MHEITPWKHPGCAIHVRIHALSQREPFSREINDTHGEGGALNANYATVEAVAVAVDTLRGAGLHYGTHYIFKTGGGDRISFDFADETSKGKGVRVLIADRRVEHIDLS